jgi:hypothetical protein
MGSEQLARRAAVAVVAIAIGVMGTLSEPQRLQAQDSNEESQIQQGFAIAPVPLNLAGKNRALVGLGSYLVNAIGTAMVATAVGRLRSPFTPTLLAETRTLASRRRSIRPST